MDNNELPYISVIITAYNRKQFLINAIKSAVNQTLDKKYYEIIVIKNFRNDIIDNFISENNIIGIISNNYSLGGKLIEALNLAKGTIISFLEDDDLFTNNKLEIVYNKFKNYSNLCYYHNDTIPVTEKYNLKDVNGKGDVSFNMSSISIEKGIINMNNILNVTQEIDHFIYLQALESNKKIIKGREKLTYYMDHHGSFANLITNNLDQFIDEFVLLHKNALGTVLALKTKCHSKRGINYINILITYYKLNLYIYGLSEKPSNLLKYFFYSPSFFKFKQVIAYVLVRIHKNFRMIIINRFFIQFQRSSDK